MIFKLLRGGIIMIKEKLTGASGDTGVGTFR